MSSGEAMWELSRVSELTERECPPGRRGLKREKKRGRSPSDFWQGGRVGCEDKDKDFSSSGRAFGTFSPGRAPGVNRVVGAAATSSLCRGDEATAAMWARFTGPRPREAAPMRSPNQGEFKKLRVMVEECSGIVSDWAG